MRIAVTGGTGFLGRYIVNHLTAGGHHCRCWFRSESDRGGFDHEKLIEWSPGELNDTDSTDALLDGVDAVVHAGLHHNKGRFRGGEGDIVEFVEKNVVGSIRLIEAAQRKGVGRFVFISTCSVHEVILDDRALDEAHPLWSVSHYGAHKAAIEKFIHSFGLGRGYNVCSLRPTGIYGLARPIERSKWFDLVNKVRDGQGIDSDAGGKEVHAADVATATDILLSADAATISGQSYNCYDMYISQEMVARIAKEACGSSSTISTHNRQPKHQIDTQKIQALGMIFGGQERLEQTVREMLDS